MAADYDRTLWADLRVFLQRHKKDSAWEVLCMNADGKLSVFAVTRNGKGWKREGGSNITMELDKARPIDSRSKLWLEKAKALRAEIVLREV